MTKTEKIIQEIRRATANHYKPLPIVLSRGNGIWVSDVEGKLYADFLACYGAANLGHGHPRLVDAIAQQLEKGLFACSNAFYNENQLFNPKLADFCGFEKVLCMNTGAEAVETFIKFARKLFVVHGGQEEKAEIIVCENNFHGRTTTIISFTTELLYRAGFGPYTPGFKIVPYGDLEALERAITKHTAAFLAEPLQIEGGVIVPPDGYLKGAQKVCEAHNILFALDEIQTGFARTGKMFAWQHEDAKPDVLIVGKSVGSYYPISAILASKDKMDAVFTPGTHGSTFGNNPLACALGLAVLEVFTQEERNGLSQRVGEYGSWFRNQLRTIENPLIKEVRGKGLIVGVELKPEAGGARKYCEALAGLTPTGVLCKETHENTIRFQPPLIITEEELAWVFAQIASVLGSSKS